MDPNNILFSLQSSCEDGEIVQIQVESKSSLHMLYGLTGLLKHTANVLGIPCQDLLTILGLTIENFQLPEPDHNQLNGNPDHPDFKL